MNEKIKTNESNYTNLYLISDHYYKFVFDTCENIINDVNVSIEKRLNALSIMSNTIIELKKSVMYEDDINFDKNKYIDFIKKEQKKYNKQKNKKLRINNIITYFVIPLIIILFDIINWLF